MKKPVFLIAAALILLVAYLALMKYDNDFRHGRMRETPAIRPHENPIPIMEAGVVPFGGGEAIYRATDGDVLKSPIPLDDPNHIADGKLGYFTFCKQCHGPRHDGNGTVGQSFAPLPTDLQSPKVQEMSEGAIFKDISFGLPDGRQPALATTIRATDRWKIVAYVKSLGVRK